MTLEELLSATGREVGADSFALSGGVEFRRHGRPFASSAGNVAEMKLDPEIAEAALRTPATSPSARGSGWVRLAPGEADEMASDRAKAWFLSAWRAADA
jgi:hypothetical protein